MLFYMCDCNCKDQLRNKCCCKKCDLNKKSECCCVCVTLSDVARWNAAAKAINDLIIENPDLSEYVKRDELDGIIESYLQDHINEYIPSLPEWYLTVSEFEVLAKNFVKSEDVYDKNYIDAEFEKYMPLDFTTFVTQDQLSQTLSDFVDHTEISNYYTKTEIDNGYCTKTEADNEYVSQDAQRVVDVTYDSTENVLSVSYLPSDSVSNYQLVYPEFPVGMIAMWAGTTAPNGWVLCDGRDISDTRYQNLRGVLGTNTTPDLRSKFIVGYDSRYTDYSTIGNTGGSPNVTLTGAQSGLRSHTHTITCSSEGTHSHYYAFDQSEHCDEYTQQSMPDYDIRKEEEIGGWKDGSSDDDDVITRVYNTTTSGGHSHTITTVSSSVTDPETSPHENRPPYYVLAFIIKY